MAEALVNTIGLSFHVREPFDKWLDGNVQRYKGPLRAANCLALRELEAGRLGSC